MHIQGQLLEGVVQELQQRLPGASVLTTIPGPTDNEMITVKNLHRAGVALGAVVKRRVAYVIICRDRFMVGISPCHGVVTLPFCDPGAVAKMAAAIMELASK